jgi:hypothetical protein
VCAVIAFARASKGSTLIAGFGLLRERVDLVQGLELLRPLPKG